MINLKDAFSQLFPESRLLNDVNLNSRTHKLHHLAFPHAEVYIKRDDELSFGISGAKLRKYASLLPWIIDEKFDHVALIGGSQSNHIAGVLQLLNEHQVPSTVFLREQANKKISHNGNQLLINLLANEIIKISRDRWHQVFEIVKNWQRTKAGKVFIMQEGGVCPAALPGAATLAFDIDMQKFDHIFIDCGTGLSAVGLLIGYDFLLQQKMVNHFPKIHIIQIGSQKPFTEMISQWLPSFGNLIVQRLERIADLVKVHSPVTAKSFGTINSRVTSQIVDFARSTGVLLDPIYNAKMTLTMMHLVETREVEGNVLAIHSGGGIGLFGYQHVLQKSLI